MCVFLQKSFQKKKKNDPHQKMQNNGIQFKKKLVASLAAKQLGENIFTNINKGNICNYR